MSEEQDPLSTNVADVDTSFPLIADGKIVRFEIRKPKVADARNSKAKPVNEGDTIRVLTVPCCTIDDMTDNKGQTLRKGFPVNHRITVTPTLEMDASKIAKNIALLCKAAKITGVSPRDIINDPMRLDGVIFDAKVKIMPEKDGFPASNMLTPIIPG